MLMKNKRIDSLFKSDKSGAIQEDRNKIDYTSSQYYTNDQIVQLNYFLKPYTNDPTI